MPAISVVSDANVVLKWFHSKGEDEVEPAAPSSMPTRNAWLPSRFST